MAKVISKYLRWFLTIGLVVCALIFYRAGLLIGREAEVLIFSPEKWGIRQYQASCWFLGALLLFLISLLLFSGFRKGGWRNIVKGIEIAHWKRWLYLYGFAALLAISIFKAIPVISISLAIDSCLDRSGRWSYAGKRCEEEATPRMDNASQNLDAVRSE